MTAIQHSTRDYLILLIVCICAFFINNGVIPADLMEARNIATAQEMVQEGNYLIPTMNGELRLAKPPLPTWISAGIEKIVPGHLFVHRYAAGFMASLMVFFMYLVTTRLTRKRDVGLIAALVLASCYNVVMMGRTATWDIYCHSFMLGAIYFLIMAFEKAGAQWGRFIGAGVFMGLSFLSKGPVSFFALLLPFLISYVIVYRPSIKDKKLPLIVMVLICVLLSTWWTSYILLFHKEIALATAEKESSAWLNHNVRPWYYYWQFPAEAGIWATFWVTSLIWFYWKKRVENKTVYIFSIIWTFAALILLSAVPEKKTRYLLPLLIPCALNVALYINYAAKALMSKGEKNVFKLNTALIALILFILPIGLYIVFFKEGYISIPLYISISAISLAMGIYIVHSAFNKQGIRVMRVFYTIIGVMILVEVLCFVPVSHLFINDNRHSIRAVREIEELDNIPFFYDDANELRMELVYEANKIIRPIDVTNDSIVMNSLPFALVSALPADSILKDRAVHIRFIDTFDNNWRQRESRRYNHNLVRHVAIITKATDKNEEYD